MENLVFTQLSVVEIKQMFRNELESFFNDNKQLTQQPETDNLLLIHEAAEFLTLSVATIYGKVSRSEIPFMKKGKRLYFSKFELTAWLKTGRNKISSDIEADTDGFLQTRKRKQH